MYTYKVVQGITHYRTTRQKKYLLYYVFTCMKADKMRAIFKKEWETWSHVSWTMLPSYISPRGKVFPKWTAHDTNFDFTQHVAGLSGFCFLAKDSGWDLTRADTKYSWFAWNVGWSRALHWGFWDLYFYFFPPLSIENIFLLIGDWKHVVFYYGKNLNLKLTPIPEKKKK